MDSGDLTPITEEHLLTSATNAGETLTYALESVDENQDFETVSLAYKNKATNLISIDRRKIDLRSHQSMVITAVVNAKR